MRLSSAFNSPSSESFLDDGLGASLLLAAGGCGDPIESNFANCRSASGSSESGQRLPQRKQMLVAIVPDQRCRDDLLTGFDPLVAQFGQLLWIALSCQKRIHDSQAGLAGDIANDVMELQIHYRARNRTRSAAMF
jgi:hypothetical protein